MTISAFMCEDHGRLDGLFHQFKTTKNKDLEKAKQFFSSFSRGLQRHIVWEEEILFPLLEERTGVLKGGPTAIMRAEHRSLKNLLNMIYDRIAQGRTDSDAFETGLAKELSTHNQTEEAVLYPWIEQCLSTEEREARLASMQAVPTERFDGRCE